MDRFQSYVPKLSLGRLRGKRTREDYASR
jgi:hypothetical protein